MRDCTSDANKRDSGVAAINRWGAPWSGTEKHVRFRSCRNERWLFGARLNALSHDWVTLAFTGTAKAHLEKVAAKKGPSDETNLEFGRIKNSVIFQ